MCSAQVPKPLRWGVVGAWLTLSVFRPAVGAAIFIAVLSAIACCALLGAYALRARSALDIPSPPPRLLTPQSSQVRAVAAAKGRGAAVDLHGAQGSRAVPPQPSPAGCTLRHRVRRPAAHPAAQGLVRPGVARV